MKFKRIVVFILLIFISGCDQYKIEKSNKILKKKIERKYTNSGFTLVYDEDLKLKKLDNRSLQIFHPNLKNKSFVKITNPINNKFLIAQVKSNKVKFSNFYNSIITNRIAEDLELDLDEPFIKIILISKDSTFVAKKAKTFDEEKEVAEKAPIDGIKISNLIEIDDQKSNKKTKEKFSYSIKVADFYYKKTAQLMADRIRVETSLKKIKIIQLSKTNFRVLIGPYNDINSLRESFEKMNLLNFENLEILKNV